MELLDALDQITEIRAQIRQTETFRGFRSVTVGFSGVLGIVAALFQVQAGSASAGPESAFVDLWVGVAVVSVLVVAAELAYRSAIESSPLKRRLTLLAIQQFAPSLIVGAAVTMAFADRPEYVWMLPGLWALIFSLGVFACCRLLPAATFWVGVHYVVSGTICLLLGQGNTAWAPWMMLGTFGVGQLLAAAILYYTLERSDARTTS